MFQKISESEIRDKIYQNYIVRFLTDSVFDFMEKFFALWQQASEYSMNSNTTVSLFLQNNEQFSMIIL